MKKGYSIYKSPSVYKLGSSEKKSKNLYDNSSPVIFKGYLSESNESHPTGFFTLNNSTQKSIVIPITNEMKGKTIRISAASSSTHNRWKIGINSSIPTETITDVQFLTSSYTTQEERDYSDIEIPANYDGVILFFYSSGADYDNQMVSTLMACVSPYFTPYVEF